MSTKLIATHSAEWFLFSQLQSTEVRLPEFSLFLTHKNWFSLAPFEPLLIPYLHTHKETTRLDLQRWFILNMHLNSQLQLPPAYMSRTEMSRLYPCPSSISSLRFDTQWTAVDHLKWSANWIVIFSHGNTSEREKGFTHWPCLTPFFLLLNPLLCPMRFFFPCD